MSDVEDLHDRLDTAREELLAALEGVTQDQLARRPPGPVTGDEERWPIRDVLWHVGAVEEWIHRMASQAHGGQADRRLCAASTPRDDQHPAALLLEALDQTRRPTLTFLRSLEDADLATEFTTPADEHRTIGRVLNHLAVHDGQHREQILALRELPEVER